jgi:hypothetical protein
VITAARLSLFGYSDVKHCVEGDDILMAFRAVGKYTDPSTAQLTCVSCLAQDDAIGAQDDGAAVMRA